MSSKCSSGCCSISSPPPSPQNHPDEHKCSSGYLSTSSSPQIHPDEHLMLVWVPVYLQPTSVTSEPPRQASKACLGAFQSPAHLHCLSTPRRASNACLGATLSPAHLHHLRSTQTSICACLGTCRHPHHLKYTQTSI